MKIYNIKYILSVFDFKNQFDFINKVFGIKFWILNIPIHNIFIECIETVSAMCVSIYLKFDTVHAMMAIVAILYNFLLQQLAFIVKILSAA